MRLWEKFTDSRRQSCRSVCLRHGGGSGGMLTWKRQTRPILLSSQSVSYKQMHSSQKHEVLVLWLCSFPTGSRAVGCSVMLTLHWMFFTDRAFRNSCCQRNMLGFVVQGSYHKKRNGKNDPKKCLNISGGWNTLSKAHVGGCFGISEI